MCAQESSAHGVTAFDDVLHLQCDEPVEDTGNHFGNTVLIANVVEKQILPKITLAGKAANRIDEHSSVQHSDVPGAEVDSFLELLLKGARGTCMAHISELHADGAALESIYLDLLAPAAQRLGPMWLDDELTFTEISIALARLQSLVTKVARSETPSAAPIDPSRHIVLARARNEQHAFGLLMVAEFFRLAGWQVSGGMDLDTGPQLNALLKDEWTSVLGLTAGSKRMALDLKSEIEVARRHSANPDLIVIVGGPAFEQDPDLLEEIGCDCSAADGFEAVEKAETMLA